MYGNFFVGCMYISYLSVKKIYNLLTREGIGEKLVVKSKPGLALIYIKH